MQSISLIMASIIRSERPCDTPGAVSLWTAGLTYGNDRTVISCMSFDSGASGRGAAGSSSYGLEVVDLYQAPIIVDGFFDDALFDHAGELSWQERALCAQIAPEVFFPEKGGSTREAKKICLRCEVREECLQYA